MGGDWGTGSWGEPKSGGNDWGSSGNSWDKTDNSSGNSWDKKDDWGSKSTNASGGGWGESGKSDAWGSDDR